VRLSVSKWMRYVRTHLPHNPYILQSQPWDGSPHHPYPVSLQARDQQAREREMLEHVGWEKKEDAFHLEQAKNRTKIRMKENRAKPIDNLAKNFLLDENFDMNMKEPYSIFRGLQTRDILVSLPLHLTPFSR